MSRGEAFLHGTTLIISNLEHLSPSVNGDAPPRSSRGARKGLSKAHAGSFHRLSLSLDCFLCSRLRHSQKYNTDILAQYICLSTYFYSLISILSAISRLSGLTRQSYARMFTPDAAALRRAAPNSGCVASLGKKYFTPFI